MGNPSALGNTDVSDNNKFVLLLDSATGDFSNPILLAEIYDFYTPLINAVLPDDLAVGDYKLRILATQGLDDFSNQTFSETYIETNIFDNHWSIIFILITKILSLNCSLFRPFLLSFIIVMIIINPPLSFMISIYYVISDPFNTPHR